MVSTRIVTFSVHRIIGYDISFEGLGLKEMKIRRGTARWMWRTAGDGSVASSVTVVDLFRVARDVDRDFGG